MKRTVLIVLGIVASLGTLHALETTIGDMGYPDPTSTTDTPIQLPKNYKEGSHVALELSAQAHNVRVVPISSMRSTEVALSTKTKQEQQLVSTVTSTISSGTLTTPVLPPAPKPTPEPPKQQSAEDFGMTRESIYKTINMVSTVLLLGTLGFLGGFAMTHASVYRTFGVIFALLFLITKIVPPLIDPIPKIKKRVLNAPEALHYTRPGTNISISVRDVFDPKDPKAMTPAQIAGMNTRLDGFPAAHLQGIPYIANISFKDYARWAGSHFDGVAFPVEKLAGFIGIGLNGYAPEVLGHEIGHFVQFNVLSTEERKEWDGLYNTSVYSHYDFVESEDVLSPNFYAASDKPYGAENVREDFASVYGNWANTSKSLIDEALKRAASGYPQLLEKTLFIASLFASGDDRTARSFAYTNATTIPLSRTADEILLDHYVFTVKDGKIIGYRDVYNNDVTLFSEPIAVPKAFLARLKPVEKLDVPEPPKLPTPFVGDVSLLNYQPFYALEFSETAPQQHISINADGSFVFKNPGPSSFVDYKFPSPVAASKFKGIRLKIDAGPGARRLDVSFSTNKNYSPRISLVLQEGIHEYDLSDLLGTPPEGAAIETLGFTAGTFDYEKGPKNDLLSQIGILSAKLTIEP